jgi:hypothetical protein
MWCRLSEDTLLRESFINIARQKNCCLMYSMASLMELSQITDPDQLLALKQIMDAVDFGFIEMDPNKVIALERQHESNKSGVFVGRHPAADHELLNYIIKRKFLTSPRMSDLFEDLKQEIPDRYRSIMEGLATSWTPMLKEARNDTKALARAKRYNRTQIVSRPGPPYTEDIFSRLIFFLVANETMSMNRNEWVDILHLVVPVAYLNFVMLDKRWVHFVRTHLQLLPPSIAKVYGPKEVNIFLQNLNEVV